MTGKLNTTSFCTGAEEQISHHIDCMFSQELWIDVARQKKKKKIEPESPGQGQSILKISSETLRISSHSAKMAGHYTLFGNRAMPIMEKSMTK